MPEWQAQQDLRVDKCAVPTATWPSPATMKQIWQFITPSLTRWWSAWWSVTEQLNFKSSHRFLWLQCYCHWCCFPGKLLWKWINIGGSAVFSQYGHQFSPNIMIAAEQRLTSDTYFFLHNMNKHSYVRTKLLTSQVLRQKPTVLNSLCRLLMLVSNKKIRQFKSMLCFNIPAHTKLFSSTC